MSHQSTAAQTLTFPTLNESMTTEVVIVGGGMVGILSAYTLAHAGKKVVLLEADQLLSGVTAATTAFVTQVIDTDITELITMYGADKTRRIWESHGEAIAYIEEIARKERIDCDFRRCTHHTYARTDKEAEALKKECASMCALGFDCALRHDETLGFSNNGYIETHQQAKFDALAFLRGVAALLPGLGVQVFEHTRAHAVNGSNPVIVEAGEYTVTAQDVLIATYDPLHNPKETFMKKGMYTTYVYAVTLPKGSIPEGTYQDAENPYHYFRIDPDTQVDHMIIGGEDNRREIAFSEEKNFRALHMYLSHLLEGIPYTIQRKWQGPILESSDGLALIGTFKPHQLLATAFSGNGMTYSGIAAVECTRIITGQQPRWKDLYSPRRFPSAKQLFTKGQDYVEEFIHGALKNSVVRS